MSSRWSACVVDSELRICGLELEYFVEVENRLDEYM